MGRVTRAAAHLSTEEVKNRLKTDPRPWCRQRWLIIYNALVEPRKAEDIARHCGVSKAHAMRNELPEELIIDEQMKSIENWTGKFIRASQIGGMESNKDRREEEMIPSQKKKVKRPPLGETSLSE